MHLHGSMIIKEDIKARLDDKPGVLSSCIYIGNKSLPYWSQ